MIFVGLLAVTTGTEWLVIPLIGIVLPLTANFFYCFVAGEFLRRELQLQLFAFSLVYVVNVRFNLPTIGRNHLEHCLCSGATFFLNKYLCWIVAVLAIDSAALEFWGASKSFDRASTRLLIRPSNISHADVLCQLADRIRLS